MAQLGRDREAYEGTWLPVLKIISVMRWICIIATTASKL